MAEFEWPCHKREAHGPHLVQADPGNWTCPGVKAHPNTMIGRSG